MAAQCIQIQQLRQSHKNRRQTVFLTTTFQTINLRYPFNLPDLTSKTDSVMLSDQFLICFSCLAPSGTIWLQRNSQTRSKPFRRAKRAIRIIYPCTHYMPYTSAIFLADLPTMSDRRDQLARKLFKSTIQPTSSLHNLLPPPWEHPSITRWRVPSKFPRIPTRTKKYQSWFSHALSHYQTS